MIKNSIRLIEEIECKIQKFQQRLTHHPLLVCIGIYEIAKLNGRRVKGAGTSYPSTESKMST